MNDERHVADAALGGKVALVTGSSRGIGAAITSLFSKQGAAVAVHGRDSAAIAAISEQIANVGGRAIGVRADVTRLSEVERMRDEVEQNLGPIDILVTSAGGSFTAPAPLEEIPEEGWRASVDGNLTATFFTIKSILPGMKQRRSGNIVTISSMVGHRQHAKAPIPYSAAKAGVEIMTRNLAAQVGPFGIRVNCVAPETILTERNQMHIPEPQRRPLIDMHPIRRLGTPEDVARAALFLASEQSPWITGIVLDVAGGAA
jgi:3-oxoacyl-[acyl-carrier protein] reductase